MFSVKLAKKLRTYKWITFTVDAWYRWLSSTQSGHYDGCSPPSDRFGQYDGQSFLPVDLLKTTHQKNELWMAQIRWDQCIVWARFNTSFFLFNVFEEILTKFDLRDFTEILGALVSVMSIWIVTGVLVYLAIERIVRNDYEIEGNVMLVTSGCAVVVNIMWVNRNYIIFYKKRKKMQRFV